MYRREETRFYMLDNALLSDVNSFEFQMTSVAIENIIKIVIGIFRTSKHEKFFYLE